MELEMAGQELAKALDDEAASGEKALAAEAEFGEGHNAPDLALAEWRERRRGVESAQKLYCGAADAYREFVESLPPSLRTSAVERGVRAMAINCA